MGDDADKETAAENQQHHEEHPSAVVPSVVHSVDSLDLIAASEKHSSEVVGVSTTTCGDRSTTEKETTLQDQSLADDLSRLSLSQRNVLICDAGYGFPLEARPRREKILAVAKQLCNFLQWQVVAAKKKEYAAVKIVLSSNKDQVALESRLKELWAAEELPDHVEFCSDGSFAEGVYLSPDSPNVLAPAARPPAVVIVGMLIDRRIQPNRSLNRSSKLGTSSARWPLESCGSNIHPHEPLNVDVVLEGMQQWWWNVQNDQNNDDSEFPFVQAATQALQRHYQRHPNRPLHKTT